MKKFFDRSKMKYYPLQERESKISISGACISADTWDKPIPQPLAEKTESIAAEIINARKRGASVICAFGAHAVKNGLGRLLGEMLTNGWFTHLASNGAAVIHDWEFAYLGKSSEDVRTNAAGGRFGTWEETGLYINLALAVGAYEGLGYGASVGKMICDNGLHIPEKNKLIETAETFLKGNRERSIARELYITHEPGFAAEASAAMDLYKLVETLDIPQGFLGIPHPFSDYSLLAAARKSDLPFTCHPMFGHDIIYTHRANMGAAVGRTAEKDFLEFVSGIAGIDNGVYLSVGSAVMSPMIFEKALSMARNAAGGKDSLKNCTIHVADIQESSWNWEEGEPPPDNPAYYLRFMKTFNRMGCKADYICADNRDFFISLYKQLAMRNEKLNY